MGRVHSRAIVPRKKSNTHLSNHSHQINNNTHHHHQTESYFILCLKKGNLDKVKVVNGDSEVVSSVKKILSQNAEICHSGWDRQMALSFRIKPFNSFIDVTAKLLLRLYNGGWKPMTPMKFDKNSLGICFQRISSSTPSKNVCNSLCLEIYGDNAIGFHSVPNVILLDLVIKINQEWAHGIEGISQTISSVISDYSDSLDKLKILSSNSKTQTLTDVSRFIKLNGKPFSFEGQEEASLDESIDSENLILSLMETLSRHGYLLQVDVDLTKDSRVFFFIKDATKEVRLPNFSGAGLGNKESLYIYRPTITRRKTSFFRSRNKCKTSFRDRFTRQQMD